MVGPGKATSTQSIPAVAQTETADNSLFCSEKDA